MLEIEMKFAVDDFASVVATLTRWNAAEAPAIEEADHYFNAPDRDFAKTDEAFRLRRIGDTNRITYKGPKQPGIAKTRAEIEIALATGRDTADQFCQLVQQLGYRPTAIVRKRRTIFETTRDGFAMQICCNEVETLGSFVEVEIIAPPQDKPRAEAVLQAAAAELGLSRSERRSYLEMVLSRTSTG
jgi:adenylate cyclase class 2